MPILAISDFWKLPANPWLLLFIFIAKIVEVSVGTMRSILVNKGFRKPAVILALVEILMWVFVASKVISDISEYPLEGIAYALGFTVGIYCGSVIEAKLAFGKVLIQAITTVDKGPALAAKLREEGCGVTIIDGIGKQEARKILMIFANRRGSEKIVEKIQHHDPTAMIVQNEVGGILGGHLSPIKSLLK